MPSRNAIATEPLVATASPSDAMTAATHQDYRSTESKYKGGAHEMYVTYDLEQRTRGGHAIYRCCGDLPRRLMA